MKPLFTLIFLLLAAAVYADTWETVSMRSSEVPMSESAASYSAPVLPISVTESAVTFISDKIGNSIDIESDLSPLPVLSTSYEAKNYAVAKPPERTFAVPQPLGPVMPPQPLDISEFETSKLVPPPVFNSTLEGSQKPQTVRGQLETVNNLSGILEQPLPPALGAVDAGTIDPKLTESLTAPELISDAAGIQIPEPLQPVTTLPETKTPSDPLGYAVLLAAMVITTIGLVYMAFVAYDYRQRWVQSLTTQNDRYVGGMYDADTEDNYSLRSWG